ncbi:Glucose 1-dehydrogenase 2 [Gemmata obscuriglobus]|uniref:KR domain-containing protein n=1 Tax=Gemmata obscuriglobus TaxID=114 RepID=A0A2Z3H4V1_9BACT|nr:SDR family oxidoreductase [Gemmata obscuriglobus]AWM36030.1 KR domain-containing protein [Gemmata obscuriglobus]QEG31397.1 Glucose 1-dehydrogenase 2 [Gemmata obscuriglobus]VTS10737.1 short-chain dehydrogenase reductase sdr : Pteridine reductase 1-possibly short-chain dehydrogenase OS=Blastopirellula marina DSM 3645 GN=DSM3645_05425 PE=3 SV=1: adh_short [Gemmata obscuriglobus UQM 2246]
MATDRVALVTGSGAKRVGAAVAEALARRGYAIAVHYRSSASEAASTAARLRAHGVEADTFPADLTDETAVRALVGAVLARFGRIDVLVNCAAVWEPKPLEEVTAADVRFHFDANALGTFLMCQRVGLAMVKQPEGGLIVNVGDWAEVRPYPGYAAYFPSKGAVTATTRCLAVELALRNPNVRVNAVLPGPVMLPPDLPEEEKRQAINATLVKREGKPENVAQAVLSFVDNDFVTGVSLPVDGGRTVYAPE